VKRIALLSAAALLLAPSRELSAAEQPPMGWPQVVADLTTERSRAITCVGLLKSSDDQAEIEGAKMTYGSTKAEMDGVIAGLTTALFAGGKPESLPTVRGRLDASGDSLKGICAAAVKVRKAAPQEKGAFDEIAKGVAEGAMEPIIKAISSGIAELWGEHEKRNELDLETTKTQLEAAKWPEFADIPAQH
jgi:hypothetical protein